MILPIMSCENEGIFYKLSIIRDKFRSTTIEERKKEKMLQNRWHTNRRSNSAQQKKMGKSIREACQAVN
jgi:hypothetical protein